MSYLNKQNVFTVAGDIYKLVKERYGLDVEGQYLDDIQVIMTKLWDKNKDKQLKSTQNQRQFFGALNKKSVELVAPGVFRNIEAGYLNKTQNNIYVGEPQNQNPVDLFEKLKKEREMESASAGSASAALDEQRNIYSSNNYQNKELTYDNQLPMTQKVRNNIEPDADADRFIDGQNSRQNIVRDVGPTNTPSYFMPNMGAANNQVDSSASLDAFFKTAANLKGEDTTIFTENKEVDDKFAKLKKQYMQDGQLDRPKDASNRVEDVIGGNYRSPLPPPMDNVGGNYRSPLPPPMDNTNGRGANNRVDDVIGRGGAGARGERLVENFFVKNDESKIADDNKRKAEQELILTNQQSNNATLNYSLVPPEKLNYQTRKYYISVDSLQRDLEAYPLPTNFQVRFE